MPLVTKTRPTPLSPTSASDELVRVMIEGSGTDRQVWCEWRVTMPNGKIDARSARCDPATESAILALPNMGKGISMAAENTHPKVAP